MRVVRQERRLFEDPPVINSGSVTRHRRFSFHQSNRPRAGGFWVQVLFFCCLPQPMTCSAATSGASARAASHSNRHPGGWTYGALVNHIWSVAGDDDRNDISNTFLQPFLAKQFPGGRTFTVNLESSYDWESERWNVPLNVGYSKVTRWGQQMLSWQGGARYFFETPGDGPDWGLRFTLTLLYPEHYGPKPGMNVRTHRTGPWDRPAGDGGDTRGRVRDGVEQALCGRSAHTRATQWTISGSTETR